MSDPNAPVPPRDDAAAALAALDAAGEMILARAEDGRVTLVNHAFLAAFGGTRADWTGRWFAVAPAGPAGGGSRRYDALMRTRSGMRWVEWDERPAPDGGSVATGRDVTHRRNADEEREAEDAAKARFFASITHEMRTPLAGAMGMARLLTGTPLRPDQREYVRAIEDTSGHALNLIDEILDLSRIEAGKLELRPEPVGLAALARDVTELLAPRAEAKGLALATVLTETAPEEVLADSARLKQILFNLVGNAVKYTREGGVRLDVSGDTDSENRARLVLTVRDTGPGISESDQANLFAEFERGAAERENYAEGAGLGLAMVKRLVEAMQGEIGVESRLGEGAVFWVSLPLPVRAGPSAARPLKGTRLAVACPNAVERSALADQARALGADPIEIAARARLNQAAGAILLIHAGWAGEVHAARASRALILVNAERKDVIKSAPPPGIQGWLVTPVRRTSMARFAVAPSSREGGKAEEPSQGWPLTGLRVLVAEDDPVNALIAEKTLQRLGAVPERARDGAEALQRLRAGGLDAALVDVRMPELDGPGVARAARAEKLGIPLIALTANTTEADRKVCLEAGMDAFLAKPVDPDALTETLTRLCKGQKRLRLVSG